MAISARNRLKGKITDVKLGDVMAHVTIRVGQNLIESVITRQSAEEMSLKKGDTVAAGCQSHGGDGVKRRLTKNSEPPRQGFHICSQRVRGVRTPPGVQYKCWPKK